MRPELIAISMKLLGENADQLTFGSWPEPILAFNTARTAIWTPAPVTFPQATITGTHNRL